MRTATVIHLADHRISAFRAVTAGTESPRDARRALPPRPPVVRWDRRLGRVIDLRVLALDLTILGLRAIEIVAWAFIGALTAAVFIFGLADTFGPHLDANPPSAEAASDRVASTFSAEAASDRVASVSGAPAGGH